MIGKQIIMINEKKPAYSNIHEALKVLMNFSGILHSTKVALHFSNNRISSCSWLSNQIKITLQQSFLLQPQNLSVISITRKVRIILHYILSV